MRIVAAMSGGVDSSVTAALLAEQGHEVIGVHMKLHDSPDPAPGSKTCCGLDDALDARAVSDRLGIPFHVMDLRQAFRKAVMDELAETYAAGRTPNPCIQCNGVLKFQVLLQRALALGAEALATGHYARMEDGRLLQAVDVHKDQSYFLFPMSEKARQKTLFPLGGLNKAQVREHAERLGLVTADKPESQEICFIPDNDHAAFVARARPDLDGAGEIVDASGRVLAHHDGYWRFTIGQRRGLGVSIGQAAYVQAIEPETRRVVVGGGEDLWHHGLQVFSWQWHRRPRADEALSARIRHRGERVPCRLEGERLIFERPVWAVAPGQAAVLYSGDEVLGGGWIRRSLDEEDA